MIGPHPPGPTGLDREPASGEARARVDQPSGPDRLEYLDGLRGLAALYVVAFHAADWTAWDRPAMGRPRDALMHGHAAVGVFIVLSGYCLTRPVVRAGGVLVGGFRGYLRRRARRILPPYYAATLLALVLIAALPALGRPSGTAWDHCIPAFRRATLTAHASLTHNLDLRHRLKINAPHWSVATEWQIYFALPLLLLPVRRRFGVAATVAAAFAIGVAPHMTLPAGRNYDTACPWYLGLFALGMAAAEAEVRARDRVPWRPLAAVGLVGLAVVLANGGDRPGLLNHACRLIYWGRDLWVRDAIIGVVTATLLVALARDRRAARRSIGLAVLGSRPMLGLGAISYSLYLTHYPILALVHAGLLGGGRSGADLGWLLALGVPASILVAAGFYAVVERPFAASRMASRASWSTGLTRWWSKPAARERRRSSSWP